VLAIAAEASSILKPLLGKGLPLEAMDGQVEPPALTRLDVDLVAYSGEAEALRAYRRALAAREGPIVPLVSEVEHPAAYCHERAVCVDTTAAGGNASLLAAS
jgi:RHH-type proline utilization regulon transcriptional repressor/proline dehydrogenase/delta 1-pyrroline-5-carboxylate dehydrogenase